MDLYIDIDNTLINTAKRIVEMYDEDYVYSDGYEAVNWWEIKTYGFDELKLLTPEKLNEYFSSKRFFNESLEFMPDAKEIIPVLLDYVDNISYVTVGSRPNLINKEHWLQASLGLYYTVGICKFLSAEQKAAYDMSDGILVDDREDILEKSNARYKVCFGHKTDWNRHWQGTRCIDWISVFRLVQQLSKEEDGIASKQLTKEWSSSYVD